MTDKGFIRPGRDKLSPAERERLQQAAQDMNKNLPRGETAAIEQALLDGLLGDLPVAPDTWLAGPIAALANPVGVLRRALFALSKLTAEVAGIAYSGDDWPFDADTGVPLSPPPPIDNRLLMEALVTAARGQ